MVDREGTHALSLSLKPTFHDELDLAEGYVPGAKINFLVTEALWWEE
ncbi:MAG: hypothetical protein GWN58_45510, partial [Anaerolineae bacterium]|nr:hypothetical protein [Anaerolineae bacterium]